MDLAVDTKLKSLLSEEQKSIVRLIASGKIRSYAEWFILKFCMDEFNAMYDLPQPLTRVPTKQSSHIRFGNDDSATYYYLINRITRDEMRTKIFEFVSTIEFLDDINCLVQHHSAYARLFHKASFVDGGGLIYDDPGSNAALHYTRMVLHDGNNAGDRLENIELACLPQIHAFIDGGFITQDQRQQQLIEAANDHTAEANKSSNRLAKFAIGATIVGTVATALIQACGTTDVKLVETYPRVAIRPPELLSDLIPPSMRHSSPSLQQHAILETSTGHMK